MTWEWKKPGIMVPAQDWEQFEALVEGLYGKRNKGRRKYLYAVAFRALLRMGADEVKFEVHRIEGEEHGVWTRRPYPLDYSRRPDAAPPSAEDLEAIAQKALDDQQRRADERGKKQAAKGPKRKSG